MSTNNQGMGGVKIEHIALEGSTLIGMQAPNKFISSRQSEDRKFMPTCEILGSQGCKVGRTPVYDCEPVDTSFLVTGGRYTLGVGNKWNIRVGGGGIYLESLGPILVDGDIIVNDYEKGYFVQANLVQLIGKKRVFIGGKRGDLHFDELFVQGNTTFFNNVIFNGGMYVNGELMCNHITTQRQQNTTDFNEDTQAFVNPAMSFHIYNGASLAAKKYVNEGLLSGLFNALDVSDTDEKLQGGMVDIELFLNLDWLTQVIPGIDIILRQIHIPCKIAFPKGISLISDATDMQQPGIYTSIHSKPRVIGEAIKKSDTVGPGHQHTFSGPAVKYMNSTQEMYSHARKIHDKTPLPHEPAVPNGFESLDAAKEDLLNQGQNYVKKWGQKLLDWCNPLNWF